MKLFFRQTGKGKPLFILHGLFGSSDNWISISKKLGEYFEVFAVDQRNHGNSFHHPIHTYDAMTDDLYSLMNELQIEKADLIGHSMGGKTAMLFASKYPEKTGNLIVADIVPIKKNENERINHAMHLSSVCQSMISMPLHLIKNRHEADTYLEKEIRNATVRNFLLKNLYRKENGSYGWKLNLSFLYDNMSEISRNLDELAFNKINTQMLLIKGADSDYVSSEDLDILKQINFGYQFAEIQNAGHWLHSEQPDVFYNLIINFLKSKY